MVRQTPFGAFCQATLYAILKLLSLKDTGKNRKRLTVSLSRLNASALYVRYGNVSFEGSLIDKVIKDEVSGRLSIRIDPELMKLFSADAFTMVDWSIRQELHGSLLGKWLHGYFSSHANPYPVKVETLHKLCGSTMSRMDNFKRELDKALKAVSVSNESHGVPFKYQIKGDLVLVERTPTQSQKRHLARKKK